MTDEQVLDTIEGMERCAAGWRLDAQRYLGSRRQWREDRADYLQGRAEYLLMFFN